VKIDRSFVADLPGSAESCAIVRAVVSLAHGLSLKVIAEGVETRAQADFLRSIECDLRAGLLLRAPAAAGVAGVRPGAKVVPLRG
jgi:EAL domain-containing protein (putative c-di-GMP-specific phosphodiesterase class I)